MGRMDASFRGAVKECEGNPWKNAAPISEMIYSFQDSLLFAEMLMTLLKNADRVKIACQSLLANISAMIMTEKGGGLWLQPNYYPFAHMANYGKGEVMGCSYKCSCISKREQSRFHFWIP